jgi:hypothetical protein
VRPPATKAPPAPAPEADGLLDHLVAAPAPEAKAKPKAAAPQPAKPPAPAPPLAPFVEAPPTPTPRKPGAKFQASPPKKGKPGPDRSSLDLAALAEDAIVGLGPDPTVTPSRPENGGRPYGPYRLLEKVAVGGMAEVFRAKRSGVEGFEKVVAVKRILPHLSDNQEFVDMFIDEAKMVAGLTHPNIVQIFDLGKIDKSYYIAMEYIHGRDLRSILKRAKERGIRIPLDLSILIVGRVSAALEYAHRKKDDRGRPMKIVHRDVSPQNMLISFEGDVKLTDFGIAKAATKASHTERGALRGKLLYMSPEQAWGKSMDRRSDIFSLGIVLYEMMTDHKPFLGESEMSILEMVRECRVAPPKTLNPRIPDKLEKVVLKALERDPDVRYQDAGEMARDLERALEGRKAPATAELAHLMAVLFEEGERGDAAVHDEHSTGEHRGVQLEVELDTDRDVTGSKTKPAARPGDGQMSIDKLLKRFGIR